MPIPYNSAYCNFTENIDIIFSNFFFLLSSLCCIILCRYKICIFLSTFLDPKANLSGPPTQSLGSDFINYEILRISQGQFNLKFRAKGCGSI